MYLQRLTLEKFRCFEAADVDFQYPRSGSPSDALGNVTLLLGDNGSGKSAILKAIAIGILGRTLPSSGFRPYKLVRESGHRATLDGDESTASISAKVLLHWNDVVYPPLRQSGDTDQEFDTEGYRITRIRRVSDREELIPEVEVPREKQIGLFSTDSPADFVVGYSANRRVESAIEFSVATRERSRELRYQRVAGLFEDDVALVPVEAWGALAESKRLWPENMRLLNSLLPDSTRVEKERGQPVMFRSDGILLPFAALSDGYRTFIGWAVDLLYHLTSITPKRTKMRDIRGVVMVDEIDSHLHPQWQKTAISAISDAFPNLQFILTTHSPVVTGSVRARNLRLAEKSGSSATVVGGREGVHGLSADQILTGSYFGLTSSRAADAESKLHGLAEEARNGSETAGIAYLRKLREGFDDGGVTTH